MAVPRRRAIAAIRLRSARSTFHWGYDLVPRFRVRRAQSLGADPERPSKPPYGAEFEPRWQSFGNEQKGLAYGRRIRSIHLP